MSVHKNGNQGAAFLDVPNQTESLYHFKLYEGDLIF